MSPVRVENTTGNIQQRNMIPQQYHTYSSAVVSYGAVQYHRKYHRDENYANTYVCGNAEARLWYPCGTYRKYH